MAQNPLHYAREEVLPHLLMVMDKADRDYAAWSIRDTFTRLPWVEQEIGEEVRQAWRERFGKKEERA